MFWRTTNREWLVLIAIVLVLNVFRLGSVLLVSGIGIALCFIYIYFRHFIPLRKKEPGFKYVKVNYDGTVQELNEDEKEYLSTEYEGGDGNRPYIKSRYSEKDGNGTLNGYIPRRRVPGRIQINPPIENFRNLPL